MFLLLRRGVVAHPSYFVNYAVAMLDFDLMT